MADNTFNLPEGLVSFHHLDKPHAWSQGDEPRYDATVCWPVKDYEANGAEWLAVKQAIHAVAQEKWGALADKKRDGAPSYRIPFRYGADNPKNPERFKDYILCTVRSMFDIPVVEAKADTEPVEMEARKVQKGMKCIVQVKPKAWEAGGNKGVTLYPVALAITDTSPDLDFNERTGDTEKPPEAKAEEAKAHFKGLRTKAPFKEVSNPNNQPDPADVQPKTEVPF